MTSEIGKIAERIIKGFPSFDSLDIFYKEVLKLHFDLDQIKKSLGAVQWVRTTIAQLEREIAKKIKTEKSFRLINPLRRQFYARVDSIIKRIASDLQYLERVRKSLRDMPIIKTKMFTVSIVGLPNVGKTTLLSKMTGSTPEISPVAFTTRRLNLGYSKKYIQCIDTPGALHSFAELNEIEKLAFIAMKYLAHVIVYVYDATEPFPWEEQERLDSEVPKFKKPMVYYVTKEDILYKEKVAAVKKKVKGIITNHEELLQKLEDMEREG